MSALPTHLDRFLDDQCDRCERPYLWCECSLPAYLATAMRGSPSDVALACERWRLEAPAECPTGRSTIMRVWGAYRRARGWE